MPSLFSATVLLFTLGLCSARCTQSRPAQPIATTSADQSISSAKVSAQTSTLFTTFYTTADPDSSIPTPTAYPEISSSSAAPTSSTAQNTTSGTSIIDGFKPGAKWQIAIQDPVDPRGGIQPSDASVVDVDLFLASKDPTLIPALHVCCDFPARHTSGRSPC